MMLLLLRRDERDSVTNTILCKRLLHTISMPSILRTFSRVLSEFFTVPTLSYSSVEF